MRKPDKAITDREALEAILRRGWLCRLAMCASTGEPYIVPLCYGYRSGSLYMHCATEGLKLDIIGQNRRVCFEVEDLAELDLSGPSPCTWTARYRSLIGKGRATVLRSREELALAAEVLVTQIGGKAPPHGFSSEELSGMAAIRVDIESMTGKRSGVEEDA